jgi:hypothetical protein
MNMLAKKVSPAIASVIFTTDSMSFPRFHANLNAMSKTKNRFKLSYMLNVEKVSDFEEDKLLATCKAFSVASLESLKSLSIDRIITYKYLFCG